MATEKEYYSSPIALRNGGTGVLVNTGSVSADDESAKPLVRESLELNQRTYTSLSQIGLTAPCTCTDVFNKLITIYPARLLVHSQSNISDVPYAGTIEFVCNASLFAEAHIYPDSVSYKPKYRTYNSGIVISWSDYADGGSGSSSYNDLTDKPSINSVTLSGNKTSANLGLANASHTHTYSDLSGVAPSVHTHSAADVTSGTLAVARGGTGVTSNPSMLTDLESTTAASVFATSPRPGVTGTLPIANGGTGATTIDGILDALVNNGNYSDFVSYSNATASNADTDITYRGYRYLTGITGKTNYPSTVGARGFLIQLGASSSGGNVQFLTTFTSSSCDLWFRVKYSASVGYLSWVKIV